MSPCAPGFNARYADQHTGIAIILGTGTNASCTLPIRAIPKWKLKAPGDVSHDTLTCVNTEWGLYTSSMLPRCLEDLDLDRESINPGQGHFEKLVCGVHLGEVCRRIMFTLANNGALFINQDFESLKQIGGLPTALLDGIVGDTSESLEQTVAILGATFQVLQLRLVSSKEIFCN